MWTCSCSRQVMGLNAACRGRDTHQLRPSCIQRHSAAPFRALSSVNDMAEVFSAERIDPGKLSEQQRAELSEKLYQIHRAIFAGLDEKELDHYVVNSPAKATRILLYRDRQKELIGYFGVHRFEEYLEGQPFRAEVGLLQSPKRYRCSVSRFTRLGRRSWGNLWKEILGE